jgi:hypothetical protein
MAAAQFISEISGNPFDRARFQQDASFRNERLQNSGLSAVDCENLSDCYEDKMFEVLGTMPECHYLVIIVLSAFK